MLGDNKKKIADLTAEIGNLQAKVAELESAAEGAAVTLEQQVQCLAACDMQAAAKDLEIADLKAKLEAAPEEIEKVASRKAAETVATLNITPETAPATQDDAGGTADGAELYERYQEMRKADPAAAAAFWQANYKAMNAAVTAARRGGR